MLDRLVDVLIQVWGEFWPLVVIQPYEEAVLTRAGKFRKVLKPGWYLKIPLIDVVLNDHVTSRTHHIGGQAATTKDGREIGYDAIITFGIADIEKATLKVTDVKDAIVDTCTGVIATALSEAAYDDVVHGRLNDELLRLCRVRGRRWGIDITDVQLAGICRVRNIRLSGERSVEHHA